jgi:hypothetical protein
MGKKRQMSKTLQSTQLTNFTLIDWKGWNVFLWELLRVFKKKKKNAGHHSHVCFLFPFNISTA